MATTVREYTTNIRDTIRSFWHGLSITLSYLARRPCTVQYPDRTELPVRDTLPPRYRGFLEVDTAICTGCQACERACPTGSIQHSREFEGTQRSVRNLTFRWADPENPFPVYKVQKGAEYFARAPLGS